jgi:YfiH family protein
MKTAARKAPARSTPKRATQKLPAPPGWSWSAPKGLRLLRAKSLTGERWLTHAFSSRIGGSSALEKTRVLNLGFTEWDSHEAVAKNRATFVSATSADEMQLVSVRQIHSDIIFRADAVPAAPPKADALITATRGLLLAVQTADCVPILLADRRKRVVAAVHAGWRGTLARIAAKVIGRMNMEFGTRAEDVIAAIGPAIAQCSYEVGSEVAQKFAAQFPDARAWFDGPFEKIVSDDSPNPLRWLSMMPPGHDPPPPTVQLDLIAANRWQLLDAGLPGKNISAAGLCTACHTDLFFSYRREQGRTGRMMSVIGITGSAARAKRDR